MILSTRQELVVPFPCDVVFSGCKSACICLLWVSADCFGFLVRLSPGVIMLSPAYKIK